MSPGRIVIGAVMLAIISNAVVRCYQKNLVISVADPTPCWHLNEITREIVEHRQDIMAEYDNRDPVDDRFPDDPPYDPIYWLCADDGRFQ